MIIKVTSDESGYHAHVEGRGFEVARGLEALLTSILRDGMPDCLMDAVVSNAKKKARDMRSDIKLSDVERDECMDLIDGIIEILKRSKRRREDD